MNFRIKVTLEEVSITATEAAVDHVDVHPTIKVARGYISDRVESAIDTLRIKRKAACSIAEKNLPRDGGEII